MKKSEQDISFNPHILKEVNILIPQWSLYRASEL